MADRLEIYRGALRLLGNAQSLASLTEERPERRALDEAWAPAIDYLLTMASWDWAVRTMELQPDEDVEPLFGFEHAYSKPDDYVRLASISADEAFIDPLDHYEDETAYWHTDADPLYVRYVSNDADYGWNIGAWTARFAKAVEAFLAMECGLPISQNRGDRGDANALFEKRLKEAKSFDALNEPTRRMPTGRLVRSRAGNRSSRSLRRW